jgi:hypothetical protein
MTIIEIRPHGNCWKVFECPGVEPVFKEKRQALDYAKTRAGFGSIEIRIVDAAGEVNETLPCGSA